MQNVTVNGNQVNIYNETSDLRDLINLKMLDGDLTYIFKIMPIKEKLIIDFDSSTASLSLLGSDDKLIAKTDDVDKISTAFMLDNDVKSIIRAELCRMWDNIEFPFTEEELTLELLIMLSLFVGYPTKQFYYSIPFNPESLTIFESFNNIARKLHYYKDTIEIFNNSSLPNIKSVRKAIFSKPELFFYTNELEKMWWTINDFNYFVKFLNIDNVIFILSKMNLHPKLTEFFIKYIEIKSIKALLNSFGDNSYLFISEGYYYISLNDVAKKIMQEKWKKAKENDLINWGISYFNLPFEKENTVAEECVIDGYEFSHLKNSNEYANAGKQLDNCLGDNYRMRSDVFVIKKDGKIYAAIEIRGNKIFQAYGKGNSDIYDSEVYMVYEKFKAKYSLV